MSDTLQAVTPPPTQDERVGRKSTLARLFARPEAGALAGAIVIYIFFFIIAPPFRSANSLSTILYVSSTYGLMATPIALLMIGGEFDLSAGVAVTTAALTASLFCFEFTTNVWVGWSSHWASPCWSGSSTAGSVTRTGIPSFLVTLGTFFMLEGLNLALTPTITNQVASPDISNIQGFSSAKAVFASSFTIGGVSVNITVVYWIVFVLLATWILLRTRIGNWIFSVGGSAPSARAVGVPVGRMKIGLFMAVGFMAWFTGMHILFAVQHDPVRAGRRQRVRLHHRGGRRRLPAHRRVRLGGRRRDRGVHLRHDQPGHRLRRLEPRLVHVLPRAPCCSAPSCSTPSSVAARRQR